MVPWMGTKVNILTKRVDVFRFIFRSVNFYQMTPMYGALKGIVSLLYPYLVLTAFSE